MFFHVAGVYPGYSFILDSIKMFLIRIVENAQIEHIMIRWKILSAATLAQEKRSHEVDDTIDVNFLVLFQCFGGLFGQK